MSLRALVVQTESAFAQPITHFLKERGDEVWEAWDLGQAEMLATQIKPNLLFLDLHFSGDSWLRFLRRMLRTYPGMKVIITNRTPDLQREMQAQSLGLKVFLRYPFRPRWINAALEKLDAIEAPAGEPERKPDPAVEPVLVSKPAPVSKPVEPAAVAQPDAPAASSVRPAAARRSAAEPAPTTPRPAKSGTASAAMPKVRTPVSIKITLPYLLLSLLLALAAAYVGSKVVFETVQDRFYNQLVTTGKQSTDWMVGEENRLLASLRLMSNTQGVAGAVKAGDAEALREMILPLAVNSGDEAIEVLDSNGIAVLSLRHPAEAAPGEYISTSGETYFQNSEFAKQAASGVADTSGDKYAGLALTPWGNYFYIAGPLYDEENQLSGTLLVGTSLYSMTRRMSMDTLGETTLYGLDGQPLASTLFTGAPGSTVSGDEVVHVLAGQDDTSLTRDLTVNSSDYTELLAPWEVRDGSDVGVLGVSLGQGFLVSTSGAVRWEIFLLVAASLALIVVVGIVVANRITSPLGRLVRASSEVAGGNLGVKVDVQGNDEVAVLAHSFNYMIAGLQEGSIYRDLLGRTVSPEVRETLRTSFQSGNLKLEGQQAISSVLMTDVRGFTSLSEQTDPATVFHWLNEYFERMVPLVVQAGGVVNKFDGDAMLAFFGILPELLTPRESAYNACVTALAILSAIDELNQTRAKRGDPLLVTGIGVNTGEVMAGGLGTRDRLHYTIIGDTVNTAQRLESLTRSVFDETGILVSHATYEALGEDREKFCLEPLGQRQVKGKADKIMVYRLLPAVPVAKADVML